MKKNAYKKARRVAEILLMYVGLPASMLGIVWLGRLFFKAIDYEPLFPPLF